MGLININHVSIKVKKRFRALRIYYERVNGRFQRLHELRFSLIVIRQRKHQGFLFVSQLHKYSGFLLLSSLYYLRHQGGCHLMEFYH